MRIILLALSILSCTSCVCAENITAMQTQAVKPAPNYRGWEYLVAKLEKDGIDKKVIDKVYLNKKMPPVNEIYFKLRPGESPSIYSGFRNKSLIKKARDFISKNRGIFDSVEAVYGVHRSVIASILLVETHFGKNTGDHLIINRLSRVGSIARPDNLELNYKKHSTENPGVDLKEVEARARYLEERFYPEVKALFQIAHEQQINLLNFKGSFAGAFGIPQFLPSTYLNHAVDGNGDGIISLFNMADAIFSVANYLKHSGWKDNASQKEKESVIWEYNHSTPYVDTVLYLAGELQKSET